MFEIKFLIMKEQEEFVKSINRNVQLRYIANFVLEII
jgi:hypothetical protein